eukprot:GHVT01056877.1.p1 GENE.GHVT01056877.1~~GHVT01056877.1.p1  ORF type:complete len:213 (-),score=23.14 GHVT01056877.1:401-1039(-)
MRALRLHHHTPLPVMASTLEWFAGLSKARLLLLARSGRRPVYVEPPLAVRHNRNFLCPPIPSFVSPTWMVRELVDDALPSHDETTPTTVDTPSAPDAAQAASGPDGNRLLALRDRDETTSNEQAQAQDEEGATATGPGLKRQGRWTPQELADLERAINAAQSTSPPKVAATGLVATRDVKQIAYKIGQLRRKNLIQTDLLPDGSSRFRITEG